MIKVVLWDIDGTVLDFIAAEHAAIKKCFEVVGLGKCTDEMIHDYSIINVKWWERLERNEITKKEVLVGRFVEFFSKYGLDTSKAEVFNSEYQVRLGDFIYYQEHAKEVLTYLKGKVLQCAVTNGTKLAQNKKLSKSGFNKIFDHVFISEDIGIEKPNIGYFEKVFEAIGDYKKDEIIIVGDSLTSDIKGGNNVGILTCFYNPKHKEKKTNVHIDYEIDDLNEVLIIIKESSK